jgi:hypothetical protein
MSSRTAHPDRSTTGTQIASALAGAAAGVAVGLLLAQTFGGLSAVLARLKRVAGEELGFEPGYDALDAIEESDEYDEYDAPTDPGVWEDDEPLDDEPDDTIGERVLEAFRNDPILAGRAIDIDVHRDATIELSGRVDAEREVDYAATIAGGVPGVAHVITRLGVRERGWRPTPA